MRYLEAEAFAALRLITRSYLVGACTGSSARLFALEDAIDVTGRAPVQIDRVSPVGDKTAVTHKDTQEVDCRQLVPGLIAR